MAAIKTAQDVVQRDKLTQNLIYIKGKFKHFACHDRKIGNSKFVVKYFDGNTYELH